MSQITQTNHCFGCKQYSDKVGILLAQLGTPDAPDKRSLRKYLKQFLSDPRVIEANRLLWWLILNGIILQTRPKRSAALYQRIWTEKGSPLLLITEKQNELLRERFRHQASLVEIEFGMRYGSPSLEKGLDTLIAKGCSKIILFPMYPQYAAATSASTYDVVFSHLLKRRWVPTLKVAEPYYSHNAYIQALAQSINRALEQSKIKPQKIVLSYHGIPEAYIERGDPYCCMCTETTQLLLPQVNFPADDIIHTYQSRFGKDPWLVPYTDETIMQLGKQGIKQIMLACPGFTADCLETLDELGHEGKKLFEEHGGQHFELIPCLNSSREWIDAMELILREEAGRWLDDKAIRPRPACPVQVAKRKATV